MAPEAERQKRSSKKQAEFASQLKVVKCKRCKTCFSKGGRNSPQKGELAGFPDGQELRVPLAMQGTRSKPRTIEATSFY